MKKTLPGVYKTLRTQGENAITPAVTIHADGSCSIALKLAELDAAQLSLVEAEINQANLDLPVSFHFFKNNENENVVLIHQEIKRDSFFSKIVKRIKNYFNPVEGILESVNNVEDRIKRLDKITAKIAKGISSKNTVAKYLMANEYEDLILI